MSDVFEWQSYEGLNRIKITWPIRVSKGTRGVGGKGGEGRD